MESNSETELKTQEFLEWTQTGEKVWISDKIKLLRHPTDEQQGRCILALQDVAKGEKLFEIQRESVLNVTTSRLCVENPEVRDLFLHKVGHWEGLIVVILYELKSAQEKSSWWPYFQVWPQSTSMNSLMYWSESEVEHLRPSGVCERIGRDGAHAMYESVLGCIRDLKLTQLEAVTWEEFVHVASVVMAYSFDMERADYDDELEDEEADPASQQLSVWNDGFLKSMVPMADMLNADTHRCNANLTYSPESLIMVAVEDIASGEQVYNIYGEFSNSELLRRYGYVEWAGSKYDCGEIPLDTVSQAIQACMNCSGKTVDRIFDLIKNQPEIRDEVLEGEPLVLDSYDCYMDGQVSPEFITLCQIVSCALQLPRVEDMSDKALLVFLQKLVKRAIQSVNANEVTKACANVCECAIDLRLREYPSHSFREPPFNRDYQSTPDLRKKLAECVLRCEVRSLQNSSKALRAEYQLIDDQILMDKIKATKRKIGSQKNKSKASKKMRK
ncbi:LAME_0A01332g1_1 [Lachancea meyersii CBS 8951]|uniref:LAME_0A01332g1_1 n=1 Tax=Lachancea meyersii CBS 8951 TaxID=1266667 RepID=A0A1G4ILS7_9SACH|nr:LAME_0A01332g1_1 [Lachancea meyersii CBS 8951]